MALNKAYVYVSISIILWASFAAVGKLLLHGLEPLQVLLFIEVIAAATLFLIALAQGKLSVVKTYRPRDYLVFAGMGFAGIFAYHALLLLAISVTSAQQAFILNYTWPLWVAVFAVLLLGERFTRRKSAAILLSFIGVAIVASNGDAGSLLSGSVPGILAALAAAVFYGLFSAMGKRVDYDPVVSMMMYYLAGLVLTIPVVFLFSSIPALSLPQLGGIVWLGALTNGVGFVTWFLALKHGDTARMANIIFLTPFVSLVFIYVLLGEAILLSSVLGLACIVAGIALQSWGAHDAVPRRARRAAASNK